MGDHLHIIVSRGPVQKHFRFMFEFYIYSLFPFDVYLTMYRVGFFLKLNSDIRNE